MTNPTPSEQFHHTATTSSLRNEATAEHAHLRRSVVGVLQTIIDVTGDILEDGMDIWSEDEEPGSSDESEPHWEVVRDDDIPIEWNPTVVVHANEADFDTISQIATPLQDGLRREAARLAALVTQTEAAQRGFQQQLSDDACIHLRVAAISDAPLATDHEDGTLGKWPMPAAGATFGAEALIVVSDRLATMLRESGISAEAHGFFTQ